MNDLRERLRDAITASVDGTAPSFDLMTALRRRHRRRLRRLAAAAAASVIVAAATAGLLAARHARPGHPSPRARAAKPVKPGRSAPLFPGGGRLLLADAGVLRWLYPNGRTVRIPGSFDAARVMAGELLAWKYTRFGGAYYLMSLNGSGQRLVLPAGHSPKLSVINALVSPDGSALAYIRQDLVSSAKVTFTLWVLNLANGQRSDLGLISPSAFSWKDNATILTEAPGGRSLLLVSAATGRRSSYLTVTSPALIHAYEQARPGAGPPAYIASDGISGTGASARIAVWLAAASHPHSGTFPQTTTFTRPAETVLAGTRALVTYAPRTPQQLNLTWGPGDLVLLQTGAGDLPGSWNAYTATLQSPRPSRPYPYGMDGVAFNPAGNVIALQDNGLVTFLPTPRPACEHTARCLEFPPMNLSQGGAIQAWLTG